MKSFALAAMFLGLSACTAANPLYLGPGGGSKSDGGNSPHDLGTNHPPPDLAKASHPDLAQFMCTDGERSCGTLNTAAFSAQCVNGQLKPDRHCPADGACEGGYCTPPAPMVGVEGQACDPSGSPYDGFCIATNTALTCQPFVTDAQSQSLEWVCADAVGPGGIGTACTRGGECRSGFCGSNGTCFRACDPNAGCPSNGQGPPFRCSPVDITVEGIQVSATSCIPN